MSSEPPRATLYLRLSVAGDDASTSISRQERDLRALAEQRGWTIAHVFVDDGRSGRSERANALAALATLADGSADVLAVWKFDRWSRQGLGAVAALLDVLDERPAALFVALQDGLSSNSPAWRIVASVLAEVAKMESDNTRLRVRSAIDTVRRSGRFSGGVVPFGYRSVDNPNGPGKVLEVDEREAAAVREVAERILAGSTWNAEARRLNEAGVLPHRAQAWTRQTLRGVLLGDAVVGRQTHRGEVLRGPDGLPLQPWEPALPLATWRDLRALPASESASGSGTRRRAARLLSGLLYCASCDSPLYVSRVKRDAKVYESYRCVTRSVGRKCDGVVVSAPQAEEHVSAVFLRALGSWPIYRDESSVDPEAVERLQMTEEALDRVAARIRDVEDEDEEARLLAERRMLRRGVSELRAAVEAPVVRRTPTGETFAEAWERAETFTRRQYLQSAIDHVLVTKGSPGRKALDPGRLSIQWAYPTDDRLLAESD